MTLSTKYSKVNMYLTVVTISFVIDKTHRILKTPLMMTSFCFPIS